MEISSAKWYSLHSSFREHHPSAFPPWEPRGRRESYVSHCCCCAGPSLCFLWWFFTVWSHSSVLTDVLDHLQSFWTVFLPGFSNSAIHEIWTMCWSLRLFQFHLMQQLLKKKKWAAVLQNICPHFSWVLSFNKHMRVGSGFSWFPAEARHGQYFLNTHTYVLFLPNSFWNPLLLWARAAEIYTLLCVPVNVN